jgi:hypothetical protein
MHGPSLSTSDAKQDPNPPGCSKYGAGYVGRAGLLTPVSFAPPLGKFSSIPPVLAKVATRPDLQHLPIVVLSSSSDQADIELARQMGAHDYLIKPHDYCKLTKMLQQVAERWLVEVPRNA